MIVVGYIYNNNGMASWCIEAARALALKGYEVGLVISGNAKDIEVDGVKVIRFDMPPITVSGIGFLKRIITDASNGFVGHLEPFLLSNGYQPECYYLNQSDLQDSSVATPQFVQAWAYPASFPAYLIKFLRQTEWGRLSVFKNLVLHIIGAIGYYRKDWRAYRESTHIFTTTKALAANLGRKGIKCSASLPGCKINMDALPLPNDVVKIAITSVDLDDKRKNVRWLLNALSEVKFSYELVLIGKHSAELKEEAGKLPATVSFTGLIPREQTAAVLSSCDIFIFGSLFEDWGYAVIEAMAAGLVVVAPDKHPFNEILENAGVLYKPSSTTDFIAKMDQLVLRSDLMMARTASKSRAIGQFSLPAFAERLLTPLHKHDHISV